MKLTWEPLTELVAKMLLDLDDKLPDIVTTFHVLEGQCDVLLGCLVGPNDQSSCDTLSAPAYTWLVWCIRTLLPIVLLLFGYAGV